MWSSEQVKIRALNYSVKIALAVERASKPRIQDETGEEKGEIQVFQFRKIVSEGSESL